ncbi:bifunctional UDP-N-acetylglucosamine pyrophosphorylase / Glucosamine-1-phosphate N-acetyltransferase [Candidatus Hakubella thermalkaliphila]|uniref:Bifunctional protein GlmU n=2 Tax=Candidatus Hakubella thermalkaliphila TaxID=2754717 RepID=A0A6V8P4S6_9ACTN|nr:bifunctional UDP-N-acetylglucosamine pyrophosphorylase / Glucosamine-1-phosphate N-acetyltransferase [Candidatus Hakubella thermalkaliphila]GFP27347.1 bifunctional UDP-N-acetylglucosamine pyrophosphorylase / Glucosamine-1-phosphate N-acetyltransferase [Candidatus Hakubella thermalkaliphila]GFP34234.1 bifunctional UDP-N-acetylglucosamine pyrophosphorylase / Glucosamine-1-phosphate N-acetyltransferase [Candidatus Hakubella thermalkaliphila]
MKSVRAKVLHPLCGRPMVHYVVKAVRKLPVDTIVLVIGHQHETVREELAYLNVNFVIQGEQLGTAHALSVAEDRVSNGDKPLLCLYGDVPLITPQILSSLLETHLQEQNEVTILTAIVSDPSGYGRIIREQRGRVVAITEDKDASPREKQIREINSGIYVFQPEAAFSSLRKISNQNAKGEYYLTDVIGILISAGRRVGAITADEREILGINSRKELAVAEAVMRQRIVEEWMERGVTFVNPQDSYVDESVTIGQDTVIFPSTYLKGRTEIGRNCLIGPSTWIVDSTIGQDSEVLFSVVRESTIHSGARIGPFSHIRSGTLLKEKVKVGAFCEVKKSTVDTGSKIPHLSYVGDTEMGKNVNIGAGTITCNYDGVNKHKTVIEDDAFIGSNTMLIAPVRVGKNATTAAGSVITKDVPDHALAIERTEQKNIEDWAKRKKQKE